MESKNYLEANKIFDTDKYLKTITNILGESEREKLSYKILFGEGFQRAYENIRENNSRFYKKLDEVENEYLSKTIDNLYFLNQYLKMNYTDKDIKTKMIQIIGELTTYTSKIFNSNDNS